MGEYTPNIKLYKPSIGETEWGDLVNNNFDVLDEQIDSIKKELITMAIKILMNQAVAHAISKDFYSIIADVVTLDYPKGFKNTFESVSSPIEYEITIDNSNNPNDLTDYQILLEINNDEQFFEDCLYDQKLLEFYDEDKTTLLNHYVEEWDTENYNAKIWIKVPSIPASGKKVIYLNVNTERTEDLSNGEAVFDFFDDFEDGDVSDWATNEYGEWIAQTDFVKQGNYSARGKQTATGHGQSWFAHRALGFSLKGYALELWVATDNAQDVYKYISSYKDVVNTKIQMALRLGYIAYKDESGWHNVVAINSNEWYKLGLILKESGYDIYVNDELKVSNAGFYNSGGYDDYICFGGTPNYTSGDIFVDVIKVRKYTEPEPTITYTRNVIPVDYVTVTFDFPEGVDKLLVTTDSDAQNVYYSTDDGNTWNPIEQDTETELPETAYSIKLKFEQATYMRGYAFLTW